MSGAHTNDVEVFAKALAVPEGERAAFLQRACEHNDSLRLRMMKLLVHHEAAGAFLENPPQEIAGHDVSTGPAGEKCGDRIGRYQLLEKIGEGGCGIVFKAEQEESVRRHVALKIIKPGMDTNSVIARFEVERQALALMKHPNIAKVFDAGATASGRPYFVMELVHGVKITDYCDHFALTIDERLRLFKQVCHAVQHAHQKGIIHRDIKPSNILVTTTDTGVASPVVIDFGIAKATSNRRLTDKTLLTAYEMLIGTPAYMSPEQADISGVDVDTRTDIYSLGVLLYELLNGSTPFDGGYLMKAGLDEFRRLIREKEPGRPSARLSALSAEDLSIRAQLRQLSAPGLIRAIRGDLDWIVMKAMEKDRTRRYETANGLALDIERHLSNEPITARPPSALYRLQKMVARNTLWFGGITLIALLLVTSLGVVTSSLRRERTAHHQAQVAAVRSEQVTQFLKDMLNGVGPSVAHGRDTAMLREILDRTSEHVGKELKAQPEVEAELRSLLGRLYHEIGNYPSSETMHRAALSIHRRLFGSKSKSSAESLNALGLALWKQGKQPEAEAAHREALEIRRELFGNNHPDVATSLNHLSDVYRHYHRPLEAEPLTREALDIRRRLFGNDSLEVAESLRVLSILLGDEGKRAESEAMARDVLAIRRKVLGPDDVQVAASLADVAWAAGYLGKWAEVESLQREALTIQTNLMIPGHPAILETIGNLSTTLVREGKVEESEKLLDQMLTPAIRRLPASANLLALRVTLHAGRMQWQEAADDAALALEHQPNNLIRFHTLVPLRAITQHRSAYVQLCQKLISSFSTTSDVSAADRVAKDCLLLPDSGVDPKTLVRLADLAVSAPSNDPSTPFFQTCKALAEYRTGHFVSSIEWASKVLTQSQPYASAQALAILAMSQERLGHFEAARTSLQHSRESLLRLAPSPEKKDMSDAWQAWLFAQISMEEATALLGAAEVRAGESPK